MRNKKNLVNIDNSNLVDYPDGRIKNNTGAGDGTPVSEEVYGDLHETKDKLLRLYGIIHNNLPDNENNGYQLIDALIALASKNDFITPLSVSGGVLNVPLKLSKLKDNESIVLLSSLDITVEANIKGTLDNTTKAITIVGSKPKINDYVRMINTPASVLLIRIADGNNLNTLINELSYLKAASLAEDLTGQIDTVACTPLSSFTSFIDRINGVESDNFLATQVLNGLLSKEDKLKLDLLVGDVNKYGTITIGDVNVGNVGFNYPVSGKVVSASITQSTSNGRIVLVTLSGAMQNTSYTVKQHVESLGNIEFDNDIKPLVFKIVSTTQFKIYVEEPNATIQNIKLHLDIIQR